MRPEPKGAIIYLDAWEDNFIWHLYSRALVARRCDLHLDVLSDMEGRYTEMLLRHQDYTEYLSSAGRIRRSRYIVTSREQTSCCSGLQLSIHHTVCFTSGHDSQCDSLKVEGMYGILKCRTIRCCKWENRPETTQASL